MRRMLGLGVCLTKLPEVDGEDGMYGKDVGIGCYVWLNVPEVDGEDGMNGKDGWIGCYV